MKNLQNIILAIILIAGALMFATCARDKAEPAAGQPAAQAAAQESKAPPAAKLSAASAPAAAVKPSAANVTENPPTASAEVLPSSAPPGVKITLAPKSIERGSPCLFTITTAETLSSLTGSLMGKKVLFSSDQSRKTWYGLAGIGLESPLGSQTITLKGSDTSGRAVTFNAQFDIEARKANIRVPPEFTDPDDEERARIAREAILKRDVFRTLSPDALWNGSFLRPVDSNIRLTAVFAGTRRFNSGPVKTHRGADFGAPQGTMIKAINSGRVILAKNMFYDGNMVTIDHGQGMLSLYLHLSKFNVKEGDMVSPGQPIGLSGSTGRSSGPHLHLQVKWEGTDIDPLELMTLKLPSNLAKSN
ncbi:MAG TPA: M23 family metallopeptidase [Blastocatellia bacterium]|nr:M23 family metallopeptidase [Blastocatellia bacterium]